MGIYSNGSVLRFLNTHTAIKCVKMNPNSKSCFSCHRLCLFIGCSLARYTICVEGSLFHAIFLLYFCLRLASRRTLFVQILTWKRIETTKCSNPKETCYFVHVREHQGVNWCLFFSGFIVVFKDMK